MPRSAPDPRARKLCAEAEKLAAEAAEARARIERLAAEVRKLEAEARHAAAEAEAAEIRLARERDVRRRELASNAYHHVYHLVGVITADSVRRCMDELAFWARTEPRCAIQLLISSPGGSVIDGMALYDYIQDLRARGHSVETVALGMAASMAGILLQAGDRRVMTRESWLLIHEASFGAVGKLAEVEDTVEWVRKIQERVLDIFAARAKVSRAFIKKRWHRRDWWISSDEAARWGFCDEVR